VTELDTHALTTRSRKPRALRKRANHREQPDPAVAEWSAGVGGGRAASIAGADLGARSAEPQHGEVVRVEHEAQSVLRSTSERIEEVGWRLDDRTALLAHQVPVGSFGEVIGGGPVTQVGVDDHAESLELLEVPVHRGGIDVRRDPAQGA
jgi:hypothetical protein